MPGHGSTSGADEPPAGGSPTHEQGSRLVIGIAGGSGSGKTTVANRVRAALPVEDVAILEHDAYYRDRPDLTYDERAQLNFDHPDSLETELLVEHVRALRRGEPVDVPLYDFKTHRRSQQVRCVKPTGVTIVEGILVFAEETLRKEFDVRVYVDTDPDIRAFRRIRRDIEQRGRSFDSIREQYYRTVRPMHLQFVEPSKRHAHVIIPEGGENAVGIDFVTRFIGSALSR
ncbi:MAG: uridine kinase [Polyangiaceae bacterium]|nr:uridine kinase [Polyangiaceae bacterium]